MPLVPLLSSRSLKSLVLCCLVGAAPLVAACDRQAGGQAQPGPQQGAETEIPDEAAAEASTSGLDRSHKGAPLPAVTVKDTRGQTLDLASLKGQPVLMNLWATWCAPCIAELPTLDALEKAGTIKVIAVSQDMGAPEKVAPFLKSHGAPTLAPWVDEAADLSFAYGGNLPVTILFDRNGKEVWRWTGGNEWNGPEAAKLMGEAK